MPKNKGKSIYSIFEFKIKLSEICTFSDCFKMQAKILHKTQVKVH